MEKIWIIFNIFSNIFWIWYVSDYFQNYDIILIIPKRKLFSDLFKKMKEGIKNYLKSKKKTFLNKKNN